MSQTKAQLISDLVQALNFTGTATAPANGLFLSAANTLKLATASTERLKIDGTELVVNDTGASVDFRVEGDTEANLLFVDASADKVGIGTSSPNYLLDVEATSGDSQMRLSSVGTGSSDDTLLRLQIGGTSANNYIYFGDNDDSNAGQIRYSHASNFMSVHTNASEALRIDSSGNVGIGLTTPGHLLHLMKAMSSSPNLIELSVSGSNTAGGGGGISFDTSASNTDATKFRAQIHGIRNSLDNGSNDLVFLTTTNDVNASNPTEKVRIKNDGKVGIGTTSPGQTLEVAGNIGINANLIHNGDTDTMLSFSADNQVDIQCASTRIGRFTTNGIATGPNKRIDILDASEHRSGVIDNCDSGANSLRLSADPDNSGSSSYMLFAVDGGSEKMRIDSSGRVGIGTTSPNSIFQISAASGSTILELNRTNSNVTGNVGTINFTASDGHSVGSIGMLGDGDDQGGDIFFRVTTAASTNDPFDSATPEVMRINSLGRVGIGTTSPDQILHVHKGSAGSISSSSSSVLTLENSNHATLQFLSPNNTSAQLRFGDPQDNGAGYIDYNHSNNALTFGTNGPEKMRLDSSGNLGIGTTSISNILHIKDDNPYLEIEGTGNSGDAGIFFNAKSNHWNLRADNSGSQNSFGLKSGTPASSTHTISIVGTTIDFFQNRNIYQRTTSGTHSIADGANKTFTITGLGYGFAKLQLAFYGEGDFCNVEVSVGGLMAGGGTFYGATVIANNSSSDVDVAFAQNQTSYVVTISNNVGNGGSIHGTALFTGSSGSAHPNIAVS